MQLGEMQFGEMPHTPITNCYGLGYIKEKKKKHYRKILTNYMHVRAPMFKTQQSSPEGTISAYMEMCDLTSIFLQPLRG